MNEPRLIWGYEFLNTIASCVVTNRELILYGTPTQKIGRKSFSLVDPRTFGIIWVSKKA